MLRRGEEVVTGCACRVVQSEPQGQQVVAACCPLSASGLPACPTLLNALSKKEDGVIPKARAFLQTPRFSWGRRSRGPRDLTVLRPTTLTRRGLDLASCIVPGGILALLPKCPACIAAYIALSSGIGISISTATYVRIALVVLSLASLTYFAATRLRRFIA